MNKAITETVRRRGIQEAHNKEHNITPRSIQKSISHGIEGDASAHRAANAAVGRTDETVYITQELVNELEVEMMQSAEDLKFEHAAALRDRIMQLQEEIGKPLDEVEITSFDRKRRRRGKSGQSNVPRPKRSS
jgi:excinuclease ABC subunit B